MKNTSISMLLTMLLMFSSCGKEPLIRYGFDTGFDKNSQGLTIMLVNNHSSVMELSGDVEANIGEVVIELIDPAGKTVFLRHIVSPDILKVNETFEAVTGNWKLQYKSIQGEGYLFMHMRSFK